MKEEKVFVTSGKKKASVRKETVAVSVTKPKDRAQKPEHTAATPSEPTVSRGGQVCRAREVSEAKVTTGPFFDNRAHIIWMVLAFERLVNVGILPNVIFKR